MLPVFETAFTHQAVVEPTELLGGAAPAAWTEQALLCRDRKVRRDLDKYLRSVPKRTQLLDWAEEQRAFAGQVLVVWARKDKLMPPEHAERLTDWFEDTEPSCGSMTAGR